MTLDKTVKYDAIIFDFDGVIADSETLLNQVLADGLTAVGLATTIEDSLRDYSGKRWADILMLIEARLGRELPASFIGEQIERLGHKVMIGVKPVAGVESFLEMTRDMPRAIASSGEPLWIKPTVRRFGIADHFGKHVYSTGKLTHGKPHPEVYLIAAKALGVDAARTIAIEDSPDGIAAAVAAGMTAIGLTAASHIRTGDAKRLLSAGAHAIVEDYEELADWIGLIN
jgi:HAD superfamily hydrolase (TIGR01509 family)